MAESVVLKPAKVASTTSPAGTFENAPHSLQSGFLLYQPDQNAFIALYADEFLTCRKDAEENNQAIEALQAANHAVTEKSLALAELKRQPDPKVADLKAAQDALDQALSELDAKSEAAKSKIEKIADLGADENKLVELLPLTLARNAKQRTWYVPAKRLKSAMADRRLYLVEGKVERNKGTADRLFNGTSLNTKEVSRRIANQVVDKAKFGKKWKLKPQDGDEFTGQFFAQWSKTMGASVKEFLEREQKQIAEGLFAASTMDPNNHHRQIDLKAEAQLMRWAAGAGLEANCLPFQGNLFDKRDKNWKDRFKRAGKAAQFNVKANAEASFALGEAKVQTIGYYPHFAGWHVVPAGAGIALDMGNFRLRGEMTLYAVAGASVALEASAALMLTAGKQGLRGAPKDKRAAKAKVGAGANAKLFAGLKEGVDLNGALQWLNPEGFIDEKSPKRKDPKKSWGEFVDVASVGTGVAAIQGLAASLGLEVGYNNGNFVIAAKASGCLGLGGEGSVACKVGADQIGQMFMCVLHQLKQADYTKLTKLMKSEVFEGFNQVLTMVAVGGTTLQDFANKQFNDLRLIESDYQAYMLDMAQRGADFIRQIERSFRAKWGWYAYLPPEARGAIIASIDGAMAAPNLRQDWEVRQMAAFAVNELVSTTQTDAHLENLLDRVVLQIGVKSDGTHGRSVIASLVNGTAYQGCVDLACNRLASAQPVIHRPFMRNDEPEFVMSTLPLHHPSSLV
ncbi:MAG TPA: hypothetical protein VFW93_02905 [Aquabacterium sp.]|uniref:hypothetical protein n=1 Tax=Aquabacterium sp. TaxID=1872578 RepID=UPI002E353E85|nr:hypothetical protein [Aquabacterium sp.]HEX5355142.1 hypothetical protein [Aquabacterium sp.]